MQRWIPVAAQPSQRITTNVFSHRDLREMCGLLLKVKGFLNLLLHVFIQEGGVGLSAVVTVAVLGHEAANSCNRGVFS